MNRKPVEQKYMPLMRGVMAALKRAAKRARRDAEHMGTRLVISRGKGWVRIPPKHKSGSTKS
jgi:hypothetical protein